MELTITNCDKIFKSKIEGLDAVFENIESYINGKNAKNMFVLQTRFPYNTAKKSINACGIPYTHIASLDGRFVHDKSGMIEYVNPMNHAAARNIILAAHAIYNMQGFYAYEKDISEEYREKSLIGGVIINAPSGNELNAGVKSFKRNISEKFPELLISTNEDGQLIIGPQIENIESLKNLMRHHLIDKEVRRIETEEQLIKVFGNR